MKLLKILFIYIILLFGIYSYPDDLVEPPPYIVDKGVCPFECCAYREWIVKKTTPLREKPDISSKIIAVVNSDKRVMAVTGEVHAKPVKFFITKKTEKYNPGDVIWIYYYIGEGNFKVWFKGGMFIEDLNFSPYDLTSGGLGMKNSRYFGEPEGELEYEWWVQIRTKDGVTGWSNEPDSFDNKDKCS